MTSIREITVGWACANGGGRTSVLYFSTTPTVASQRTALQTFLTAYKAFMATTASYGINLTGVEVDDASGELTGSWSEPTLKQGTGLSGSTEVADASQALVQWRTDTILNGRFLRGRTFLPGLSVANLSGGNLGATAQSNIQAAGTALVTGSAVLEVWNRPLKDGDGNIIRAGTSRPATAATVWEEMAVLRRRRH